MPASRRIGNIKPLSRYSPSGAVHARLLSWQSRRDWRWMLAFPAPRFCGFRPRWPPIRDASPSHGQPRPSEIGFQVSRPRIFPHPTRAARAPGYRSASVREAHNCVGSKLLRSCHWRPSPSGRGCVKTLGTFVN